jgi:hypothetical protein
MNDMDKLTMEMFMNKKLYHRFIEKTDPKKYDEQQTYTINSENLSVGGGSLLIQAKKSGLNWTSARIISKDRESISG